MNSENPPANSAETEEVPIPKLIRFNPAIALAAAVGMLLSLFLDESSGFLVLVYIATFFSYMHFVFAIFAEQAFAYKEKGKINWKPIWIIIGATFLCVIVWEPLEFAAFAAAFYSERITASHASKSALSFVKKAAGAATAGLFALLVVLAQFGDSKSEICDAYNAYLNQSIMANKQRIYENVHHPFGSCTSAQVRNFNIEWNGDVPETVSYKIELFWNTLVTPKGYTEIAVEEIYNYNTKKYELTRCEVLRTNGKLSGDFWFDVGWGIGALSAQ